MATQPQDDAASAFSSDAEAASQAAYSSNDVVPEELPLDEVSTVEAADDYDTYDTNEIHDLPAAAPPARRTRTELPNIDEITAEDRSFIHRVFNQVKDVDFRSAPPPPPRKNLAGLDKKMQFLRDRVRELERDLARVGWIWSIKQRQVDAVDQLLDAKESERSSAVERYTMLRDQAARSAQGFRTEEARLNAVINEGVAHASRLEGELAALRHELDATVDDYNRKLEVERDEKAQLLAEFRNKIETAQQAFNQLRETSTRSIADGEARIASLTGELTTTTQDLASAHQQIDAMAAAAANAEARINELVQQLDIANADLASTRSVIAEQEAALATARDDTARLQTEYESKLAVASDDTARMVRDLETQIATANDETARVRADLENKVAAANDDAARLRTELEARIATAEQQLTDANRGLDELRAAISERDKRILELTDEAAVARNERESRAAELQATIRERELKVEDTERSLGGLKAEIDEHIKAQEQQKLEIEGLKTDIATLQRQLDVAETGLRESREASSAAESRLADRDGELMALREEQRIVRVDNERMSRRLAEIDRNGIQAEPVDTRTESGSSEVK